MDELKIPYTALKIDKMDNSSAVQNALLDVTGQRTVPNVFIKGKSIGGNDATQAAAKDGSLQEILGM